MSKRRQSQRQKRMRKRHDEKAYLFDKDVTRVLGEADRGDWEFAIAMSGGDVQAAATKCGIAGIPRSAKVLWGRSADAALGTYRAWQKRKAGGKQGRKRR